MEHQPAINAGIKTFQSLQNQPPHCFYIADVTLRDGQQQRTAPVSAKQRIEVFDQIVSTGVDRIEIGHLGNKKADQELARAIIHRVAIKEKTDSKYSNIKLQVLFGSQQEIIQDGIKVLQEAFQEEYKKDWQQAMANKIVVHVYDRIDEQLTNLSRNPYTQEQSAERICKASEHAIKIGLKHFSISGEAITAVTPEEAIKFHRHINDNLFKQGAETININLANTYGFSTNTWWNPYSLTIFNTAVKHDYQPDSVTTSIHSHNDVDNAVSVAIDALIAGFDRVEGTINGMGERQGNVATIDVIARILESARHQHELSLLDKKTSLTNNLVSRNVYLPKQIINNLKNWYSAAKKISHIFGLHAEYRFNRTAVGNPYAHDNGSGPHDQAMRAGITNPFKYPPDRNYEWMLTINSILGRPQTEKIAIGDPKSVQQVTVSNHAGGGSTNAIIDGTVERANNETITKAKKYLANRQKSIINFAKIGTPIAT